MNFIVNSVRNKLLSVLIIGAIVVSAIAGTAVSLQNNQLDRFRDLINTDITIERDILALNSDFKTQVQEWKNVLLRGHKQGDRDKYWGRFQESKASILAKAESIVQRTDDPIVRNNLQNFADEYQVMMTKYEEGYEIFMQDFSSQSADTVVRGIDREPSNLLKETAKIISKKTTTLTEENMAKSAVVERWTLPSILAGQIIVLFLGTVIMNKNIVVPTQKLIAALEWIKEKDFSHSVEIASSDELGQIGRGLEEMRGSLVDMLREMEESSLYLTEIADSVSSISGEIQKDTQAIQQNMEQSATATNEMSATIQEVAQNAASAAKSSSAVNENTEHGQQTMEKTISSMKALESEVTNTADAIRELESLVAGVGSVLDVIVNIAEQTNLLALNAAIEAARAGEQGRGFAVVADEVRTLAQRTQDSTAEIKSIIEAAQAGAEKAVAAMNIGVEQTQRTSSLAEETNEIINAIKSEVALMSDMNMQIATAAEEQSAVAEEINKSVIEVSDSARNSAEQATTASSTSEQLMGRVTGFNRLVGQYKS